MTQKNIQEKGALLILILVFGSVFFLIMTSYMGFVVTQTRVQEKKLNLAQAREIAEAGLNYYKWYLAHNPNDITNGTGQPGPYVVPYKDPELGTIGEFSLEISSTNFCGDIASIDITSTGYTYAEPNMKKSIYARYSRPTVAEYAYIINANVWAGDDRTIVGPYHSNGIIRMDGTNNSTVSSGQESWVCDNNQLNCDPPNNTGTTLDAVFGSGPNSALWSFPAPPINFTGLTVNLANIQTKAQNNGGIYIPPSSDYGYRVIFQSDNTVDVYVVNGTYSYWGYDSANGWQIERNVITNNYLYGSYNINPTCPVVFVEDKVWLEGNVASKVTLAAADIDTAGVNPSIILNDDITYTSTSSGLLAVAENDVLVGMMVPDNMKLNGIFTAQQGRFGRNHYNADYLTWWLDPYVKRNSLTMNGTVVSNGRVGTKWSSGSTYLSGFNTRYNSYDRDLVNNPPPLAPNTSDDFKFIEWREKD